VPVEEFPNVVPLEKQAGAHTIQVDVPDTAPPADAAEQGLVDSTESIPAAKPPAAAASSRKSTTPAQPAAKMAPKLPSQGPVTASALPH